MIHNELRKDFLLDRWVVIATERARRPTDFARHKEDNSNAQVGVCPLCPGNEHLTPAAIMLYRSSRGQIFRDKDKDGDRPKDWLVRCVPNLYPAFAPPQAGAYRERIVRRNGFRLAVGHHEVLIESPVHDAHPADAKLSQIVNVTNAYFDRMQELAEKPYVKYVSVFRNHGQQAGASLTHAHSQLIAMPFVPSIVATEIRASFQFWKKNQKCVFCEMIENETGGPRLVHHNSDFTAIAPYASKNPMEFWIIPKKHAINLLDLGRSEIDAFAVMLRSTLKALKNLLNDPPYNYGIHLSVNKDDQKYYHWHLEVYPKLVIWAGFEKSTGVYINTIPPEAAAKELKKAIEP